MFAYLLLFALLNWRLFAIGSPSQLFLYGDNLTVLNNLFYLFEHFKITAPFATFVGEHGMRGAYPMSEPQNSLFYAPTILLLFAYKVSDLGANGLYYLLLASHVAHMLVGVYFVFRLTNRILMLNRQISFIAGLVYLGIGWNAASFGTNTLSYMTGLVPLALYVFLVYLREPSRRRFCVLVLTLTLFLYAGGVVNYFFYLWLNFLMLSVLAWRFQITTILPNLSRKDFGKVMVLVLVVAPLWATGIYAVQLAAELMILPDIRHATTGYDALSMFGNHFGDLIGLLLPKFGMIGFGTTSNPDMYYKFVNASQLYIGMLVLLLLIAAVTVVRSRLGNVLLVVLLVNLLLSFGGMFPIFDLTLLFPGNSQFRGHYKYFSFVGLYVSLVIGVAIHHLISGSTSGNFRRLVNVSIGAWLSLVAVGLLVGVGTFIAGTSSTDDVAAHYSVLMSALNYVMRTVLMLGLAIAALYLLHRKRNQLVLMAAALLLLFDTSINYKLAAYYDTPIGDLTSTHFFECCSGETVVNNINGYSQLYLIPEVLGVDPLLMYTAIPNRYLVEYSESMLDQNGSPKINYFRAAGIDGLLTNAVLSNGDFPLASTKKVGADDAMKYFHYNPDRAIHSSWGGGPSVIGAEFHYYSARNVKKNYLSPTFLQDPDPKKALEYLETSPGELVPFLTTSRSKPSRSADPRSVEATVARDSPANKSYVLPPGTSAGVFVTTIPYSRIWGVKVGGVEKNVERVNFAFSGVRLDQAVAGPIEFFVRTEKLKAALVLSGLSLIALVALLILPAHSRRPSPVRRESVPTLED